MVYIDDDIYYSIENQSARIKNLYGISDFYNFIKKPDNTPSNHRHFQVFFYPEFNNYKDIINENGVRSPDEIRTNIKDLFNISILERITLSIQSIQLPQYLELSQHGSDLLINTVLGSYITVGENQYFDAVKTLTFTLIDQMKPLFEKFFTKWIFLASIAETEGPNYRYGYPFPKMNVAIKYYREDQIKDNNENLHPNFIYYFRGVYPTSYQPCKIAHAFDIDEEISRKVIFNFNTCWVLPNAAFARRYKLDYLFNTQNQLSEMYKTQQELTDLKAAKIAADKKQKQLQEELKKESKDVTDLKAKQSELLAEQKQLQEESKKESKDVTNLKAEQSALLEKQKQLQTKFNKRNESYDENIKKIVKEDNIKILEIQKKIEMTNSKLAFIDSIDVEKTVDEQMAKQKKQKVQQEKKRIEYLKKMDLPIQSNSQDLSIILHVPGKEQYEGLTVSEAKKIQQRNRRISDLKQKLENQKQTVLEEMTGLTSEKEQIYKQSATKITELTQKNMKQNKEDEVIIFQTEKNITELTKQIEETKNESQKSFKQRIRQNNQSIVDLTKQIKDNEEKSKTAISSKINDTNKQIEELNKKLDAARKKKDEMNSSFKFDENE